MDQWHSWFLLIYSNRPLTAIGMWNSLLRYIGNRSGQAKRAVSRDSVKRERWRTTCITWLKESKIEEGKKRENNGEEKEGETQCREGTGVEVGGHDVSLVTAAKQRAITQPWLWLVSNIHSGGEGSSRNAKFEIESYRRVAQQDMNMAWVKNYIIISNKSKVSKYSVFLLSMLSMLSRSCPRLFLSIIYSKIKNQCQ